MKNIENMYKIKEFLNLLEEYAPLSYSHRLIERGDYDNSGIIVENHDSINKILFTLDLSEDAVNRALELGCDTVVTHHPAIYMPIKNLSVSGQTRALILAVKGGLNVISMHLNLDVAKFGVDYSLATLLGGKKQTILDALDDGVGYGREFKIEPTTIDKFKQTIIKNFGTEKVIAYGNAPVSVVASFCGAGGSHALSVIDSGLTLADTIVTSDLAHHQILAILEKGKNLVIIPHYLAEEYGFNKFYEYCAKKVKNGANAYYFADKRFM